MIVDHPKKKIKNKLLIIYLWKYQSAGPVLLIGRKYLLDDSQKMSISNLPWCRRVGRKYQSAGPVSLIGRKYLLDDRQKMSISNLPCRRVGSVQFGRKYP
jgi:hypothetical protein